MGGASGRLRSLAFQYPRSDRRRCNSSKSLKSSQTRLTFSILGRIGGDATWPSCRTCRAGWCSFSILGRIGGDATIPPEFPPESFLPFSILGRIGGDATGGWLLGHLWPRGLSVSSVGSEAMQPFLPWSVQTRNLPFSILGRIGGDATHRFRRGAFARGDAFSILGRIGGDATSRVLPIYVDQVNRFQYPRSDRRRCNQKNRD